jgi:uncharacterized protein with HEPN domain
MSDEARKYLLDISEAIKHIDQPLGGKRDFHVFDQNLTIQRAVERELEIIGEAISRLLKLSEAIIISQARQIVNLRNRVIHAYDAVDKVILWGVIMKYLPMLTEEVQTLLATTD